MTASEDCLSATSILAEPFFVFENDTISMTINTSMAMSGARFCMYYDSGIAAIVPTAFIDIEEPMITSIVTSNCGYAAVGMESVSIVGSGLGIGDEVYFANGNCNEMGLNRWLWYCIRCCRWYVHGGYYFHSDWSLSCDCQFQWFVHILL